MTNRSRLEVRPRAFAYQDALHLAKPIIQEICEVSGTPGLAIGIFDRDGAVLESYHGYRDIREKRIPDADTVFNLGSMCKGFTALAVACLVGDKKVHWDDRIETVLGDLRETRNGRFTIRDLLGHRTGLCRSDPLFLGSNNRLLLPKARGLDVFASLEPTRPPRQDFAYNNFGYHAVGCIVEKISSMSYGDFLAQRIFVPLNMNRTFTTLPPVSDDNVSRAYVPYRDLRLRRVPAPRISSDTVCFAAGSVRSCMRDLLNFYGALLRSFAELVPRPVFDDLKVIAGDVRAMFDASISLRVTASLREQSYGMGWARTQLPNQMSELSGNSGLLDEYPTIGGDATAGPLVLHHGGNNLGCSSAVYMFPELGSGIVVLGNALGHCDATDWAAQALTEAFLCGSIRTAFLRYATAASSRGRSAMECVQAMLDGEKRAAESPADIERYTGTFWHKTGLFRIVVVPCTDGNGKERLNMSLQGRDDETYVLRHHYGETFIFNETLDQIVDRGQWCRPYWFYKIEFLTRDKAIYGLRWRIDEMDD